MEKSGRVASRESAGIAAATPSASQPVWVLGPNASRPVSGLASWRNTSRFGAFPCVAQWRIPSVDSLTVAGAVPDWPCCGVTGFPFQPVGRTPPGHLEARAVYAIRQPGPKDDR